MAFRRVMVRIPPLPTYGVAPCHLMIARVFVLIGAYPKVRLCGNFAHIQQSPDFYTITRASTRDRDIFGVKKVLIQEW